MMRALVGVSWIMFDGGDDMPPVCPDCLHTLCSGDCSSCAACKNVGPVKMQDALDPSRPLCDPLRGTLTRSAVRLNPRVRQPSVRSPRPRGSRGVSGGRGGFNVRSARSRPRRSRRRQRHGHGLETLRA